LRRGLRVYCPGPDRVRVVLAHVVKEVDFNEVYDESDRMNSRRGPMTHRGEERASLGRKLHIFADTFLAEFHNSTIKISMLR
jgi:hypothetical protein